MSAPPAELKKVSPLKVLYPGPRFNELVIQLPIPYENVAAKFTSAKIIPGLPLEVPQERLLVSLQVDSLA